jgi:hypothetical protein
MKQKLTYLIKNNLKRQDIIVKDIFGTVLNEEILPGWDLAIFQINFFPDLPKI